MGEKIRDWTEDLRIRGDQLDPSTPEYEGHADFWAKHENFLNECLTKFQDKGCSPDDLPEGFKWKKAVNQAKRKAPSVTGPGDFTRRGGLVPFGIGLGPV